MTDHHESVEPSGLRCRRGFFVTLSGICLFLAACAGPQQSITPLAVDISGMPRLAIGAPMPAPKQTIERILVASCMDEEKPEPDAILSAMARLEGRCVIMTPVRLTRNLVSAW